MFARAVCTETDKCLLLDCVNNGERSNDDVPVNLAQIVVTKPWGHEYSAFENHRVAIWKLYIKHNEATSLHCHLSKSTALVLLSGQARCHTSNNPVILNPFDALLIERGAFHSTEALSEEGIHLMEIDNPPLLTDLVRLKDRYGRAGKPYEGKDKMSMDSNNLVRFREPGVSEHYEGEAYGCLFYVEKFGRNAEPKQIKYFRPNDIIAVLDGEIMTEEGGVFLRPGNIAYAKDFLEGAYKALTKSYTLMVISQK